MNTRETETSTDEKTPTSPASTSCDETGVSKPWPDVVRLGQAILHELGLAETNQSLARWIAHRIAELLERSETSDDPHEREAVKRECADLIIRLWQQRRQWPDRAPLSKIVRVLNKLVPQEQRWSAAPSPRPSNWFEALAQLGQLQDEEMLLCWQAAVLDLDEQELADELTQADTFADELDENERRVVTTLRFMQELKVEQRDLQQLSPTERTEYFQKQLAEIHGRRAELFTEVRSSTVPLASLLSTSEANGPDDDDNSDTAEEEESS